MLSFICWVDGTQPDTGHGLSNKGERVIWMMW